MKGSPLGQLNNSHAAHYTLHRGDYIKLTMIFSTVKYKLEWPLTEGETELIDLVYRYTGHNQSCAVRAVQ